MNKTAIANILVRANAFAPFRFLNRSKLLILMYHRFSAGDEAGKTSRSTFEKHLEYLARNYNVVSLTDAVKHIGNGEPLPHRSAVITVDDGYRDFYDTAFPLFKKFHLPAAIYVVTGFINGECWIWTDKARHLLTQTKAARLNFNVNGKTLDRQLNGPTDRFRIAAELNSELKKLENCEKERSITDLASHLNVDLPEKPPGDFAPLTWSQVRELGASGIEIGSHTATHPILLNVDESQLMEELDKSKAVLENELQAETPHFCYPNGDYSPREAEATARAGYRSAVTTEIRLCDTSANLFALPRIDAEPEMHRFVQATSGFDAWK